MTITTNTGRVIECRHDPNDASIWYVWTHQDGRAIADERSFTPTPDRDGLSKAERYMDELRDRYNDPDRGTRLGCLALDTSELDGRQ